VGTTKYKTNEYITTPIYLPRIDSSGNKVLVYIRREIYLIDNLRIKILISNDIIRPEGIVIDITKKSARISSYNVTIDINSR